MAALHTALKSLAPITFSDLPTGESDLDSWLSDLFSQSQLILDSVPIAEPSKTTADPRSSSSTIASNASEITPSTARPPAPPPDHEVLQKEWGKPIKLGAKENPLEMSVYKLGGKDGRGAWFARRSVHEGISFSRFKKALVMEFPESLAIQGAPGEGNVRGIGGETKHEDLKSTDKGRVEVYRLSAQFPGPTTPRDFVTLLVTSSNAIKAEITGQSVPRHYIIISKPCDHPETQAQNGFIRGSYESVEFIREVPRVSNMSRSAVDLSQPTGHTDTIGKDAMIRNAQQKTKSFPLHEDSNTSETIAESGRKRSLTVPSRPTTQESIDDSNPVEWIMITRSDPGGSVPRFMVERGTPSSICADAEKFLNWACQQDFDDAQVDNVKDSAGQPSPWRRDSFQSFRSSRMAGVQDENAPISTVAGGQNLHIEKELPADEQQPRTGLFGAVSGAATYLSSYTPQIVLDHLPKANADSPEESKEHLDLPQRQNDDDATSTASFESADSHLNTSGSETASPSSSRIEAPPKKPDEHLTHHERELRKLEQRRLTLQNKFSESRSRLEQDISAHSAKDELASQKVTEKHEKELKKHQEKYERELRKIDERQEKEKLKIEAKKKKQVDKDEKAKLTRERDEARQELDLLKKESAALRNVVEDLQRQNTSLVAKLGKAVLAGEVSGDDSSAPSVHGSHKKTASHNSATTSLKSQ